ncbi:MAG TPA: hypothetical protein VF489_09215 [Sphingobium sp.]
MAHKPTPLRLRLTYGSASLAPSRLREGLGVGLRTGFEIAVDHFWPGQGIFRAFCIFNISLGEYPKNVNWPLLIGSWTIRSSISTVLPKRIFNDFPTFAAVSSAS